MYRATKVILNQHEKQGRDTGKGLVAAATKKSCAISGCGRADSQFHRRRGLRPGRIAAAAWRKAKTLKVNPDSPQRAIRRKALEEGKIIYMAVPRLHSGKPFIELDPQKIKGSAHVASSIKGAEKYGRPVNLEEVRKIDLIVCGSVAVNRQGARVGKGGGYSDLEFALLTEEKKIGRNTPI